MVDLIRCDSCRTRIEFSQAIIVEKASDGDRDLWDVYCVKCWNDPPVVKVSFFEKNKPFYVTLIILIGLILWAGFTNKDSKNSQVKCLLKVDNGPTITEIHSVDLCNEIRRYHGQT